MIARGVKRAMSTGLADPSWYDAIYPTEQEAQDARRLDESQLELDRMANQMAGGF